MTLLIGTDDGLWSGGRRLDLAGGPVVHMTSGSSGVWVLLDGGELVRWEHGGPRHLWKTDLHLNCVLLHAGLLWLGGADARLYRLEGDEVRRWEPFDRAPGRDTWHTPWGGPPDVRSMAEAADGALMVNVHVGGVLKSLNGGAGWQPTTDIAADVHEVASGSGFDLVASARGLGWSTGEGFRFTTDGLHASYCRAVVAAGGWLFVSVSSGPGGGRSAVYRTPDPGAAFERCSNGLPDWFSSNIDTHCLAASGGSVFVGDRNGTVYRSDDGGELWKIEAAGLPGIRCLVTTDRREPPP